MGATGTEEEEEEDSLLPTNHYDHNMNRYSEI
jgi:hypothetical protein